MIEGKIIRGVGGIYYVDTPDLGVYACRARGIFRKEKMKPLPGDNVAISITCEEDREGSLDEIFPRKNALIRPACANIDQALVMFAAVDPQPSFSLMDRFLIYMQQQEIPVVICMNKADLAGADLIEEYRRIYAQSGCDMLVISTKTGEGIEEVKSRLSGKTTALAGPSGVGKSSLTNTLHPQAPSEVGELSRKIRRGKQTTRHTQLLPIGEGTYLLDTPGFASLYLENLEESQLRLYYPEFVRLQDDCRFGGCVHLSEPDCAVKEAVAGGRIHRIRYDNYRLIYEELRQSRKY